MQDLKDPIAQALRREHWNKGKLTGAKPPLRPKHVWSIRSKLQIERRTRDLAMFNLAIDSKLRGCDIVLQHRARLQLVWHTFAAANQGDTFTVAPAACAQCNSF